MFWNVSNRWMKGKTKFSLHTFYLNLFCITTLFKRTPKVTVFCVLACVRNQNTISLLSCAHLNGFEHFKKPENCAVWPFKSPHTLRYTEYFPIIGNQWISKNSQKSSAQMFLFEQKSGSFGLTGFLLTLFYGVRESRCRKNRGAKHAGYIFLLFCRVGSERLVRTITKQMIA